MGASAQGYKDPNKAMQDLLEYMMEVGAITYDGTLKLLKDFKFSLKTGFLNVIETGC